MFFCNIKNSAVHSHGKLAFGSHGIRLHLSQYQQNGANIVQVINKESLCWPLSWKWCICNGMCPQWHYIRTLKQIKELQAAWSFASSLMCGTADSPAVHLATEVGFPQWLSINIFLSLHLLCLYFPCTSSLAGRRELSFHVVAYYLKAYVHII